MSFTPRQAGFILARIAIDVCNVSVELTGQDGVAVDPVGLLAATVEGAAKWLALRVRIPIGVAKRTYIDAVLESALKLLQKHEAFQLYDERLRVFTRGVIADLRRDAFQPTEASATPSEPT